MREVFPEYVRVDGQAMTEVLVLCADFIGVRSFRRDRAHVDQVFTVEVVQRRPLVPAGIGRIEQVIRGQLILGAQLAGDAGLVGLFRAVERRLDARGVHRQAARRIGVAGQRVANRVMAEAQAADQFQLVVDLIGRLTKQRLVFKRRTPRRRALRMDHRARRSRAGLEAAGVDR